MLAGILQTNIKVLCAPPPIKYKLSSRWLPDKHLTSSHFMRPENVQEMPGCFLCCWFCRHSVLYGSPRDHGCASSATDHVVTDLILQHGVASGMPSARSNAAA